MRPGRCSQSSNGSRPTRSRICVAQRTGTTRLNFLRREPSWGRLTAWSPESASKGCGIGPARMSALDPPGWRSNRELEAATSCRRTPSCAGSPSWRPRICGNRRLAALIPIGGGTGTGPRREDIPRFARSNGSKRRGGFIGRRVGGRVDRTLTRIVLWGTPPGMSKVAVSKGRTAP